MRGDSTWAGRSYATGNLRCGGTGGRWPGWRRRAPERDGHRRLLDRKSRKSTGGPRRSGAGL